MKMAVQFLALACLLALLSDQTLGVPVEPAHPPPPPPHAGPTFFDSIFNIPQSALKSVNNDLNAKGAKCPDGTLPVNVDGKGTCHDRALDIPKSVLKAVNDFLNG